MKVSRGDEKLKEEAPKMVYNDAANDALSVGGQSIGVSAQT